MSVTLERVAAALDALAAKWRYRADQSEHAARTTDIEPWKVPILRTDAKAIRLCVSELEEMRRMIGLLTAPPGVEAPHEWWCAVLLGVGLPCDCRRLSRSDNSPEDPDSKTRCEPS